MKILDKTIPYLEKIVNLKNMENDRLILNQLIDENSFNLVNNRAPKDIKKIAIIIPGVMKFSGGITSILRIGTAISNNGYDLDFVSYVGQTEQEMEINAKFNLNNVKGNFTSFNENSNYDIVIATCWESVYYAKKMSGYKIYFVQDYEPYFNKFGEFYILSKKTYEFGFHIISLGEWNVNQIKRECEVSKTRIDTIDFPYENSEYHFIEKDFKSYSLKNELRLAVYVKFEGKRFPSLIQVMLEKLYQKLKDKNINLIINYFGMNKNYKPKIGNNLGRLTKKELESLYHTSDFGMIASMTNISLIPYEMIACGLPIIEFYDGTFKDFFPEGCAILTSLNYLDLYEQLISCILDEERIRLMTKKAHDHITQFSWDKTTTQFVGILKDLSLNEG